MEVRLLGAVEIWHGGRQTRLASPFQRCVLAVLATSPGLPVAPELLEDRVWGEQAPRKSREALYSLVSRLRRQVTEAGGALRRHDGGYVLEICPEQVDLHRARQLAAAARSAATGSGDGAGVRQAAERWREVCQLWRATPLAGVPGDWAARVREGLVQERLTWVTERFQAELQLGRHREVIGALSALHIEYPLAEPLTSLLMQALHGAGRQAEALEVYARTRERLVSEIGAEPGWALRHVHQQVLRREPDGWTPAAAPAAAPTVAAASAPAENPAQLPADVPDFQGRAAQLGQLDAALAAVGTSSSPTPPVVIEGCAGMGKTALAVYFARRVADQFPDGQLYVDLRGYAHGTPLRPREVLGRFLRALGVPPAQVPDDQDEAAAAYRSRTHGRRVLVVLDNAADAAQVRPLLPGGSGCLALVTSRDQLGGLVARQGARRVTLDVLSPPESESLLAAALQPAAVAATSAELRQLAAWCGHLPLALRITAARLTARSGHPVSAYLARLRDHDRLASFVVSEDDQTAVREAFAASYTRLPAPEARIFRLLGLAPGPDLTLPAVAALAGLPSGQAGVLLDALARMHLVAEPTPDRYTLHDLLQCYAAERADSEETVDSRRAALARLYDYYLRTCRALVELLYPHNLRLPADSMPPVAVAPPTDRRAALSWLDAERSNLVACVIDAAARGQRRVSCLLADCLRAYLQAGAHLADWQAAAETALRAADALGDPAVQAAAELSLAGLHARRGRHTQAAVHARRTAALAAGRWPEAVGAAYLSLGSVAQRTGRPDQAVSRIEQAIHYYTVAGRRAGKAAAHITLGVVLLEMGRLRAATAHARQAERMFARFGASHSQAAATGTLGEINRQRGSLDQAQRCLTEAGQRWQEIGDRFGEGNVVRSLAELHRLSGRAEAAADAAEASFRIARQVGYRRLEAEALVTLAALQRLGEPARALATSEQAVAVARDSQNRYPEVEALVALAYAYGASGAYQEAANCAQRALDLARQAGYQLLTGEALTALAVAQLGAGNPAQALTHAEAARVLLRETGGRIAAAGSLLVLAHAEVVTGRPARARDCRRQAGSLLGRVGVPARRMERVLLLR